MEGDRPLCPVCSEAMTRSFDDVVRFAHCPRCGGEWVCRARLGAAVDSEPPQAVPPAGVPVLGRGLQPHELKVEYRRCPECRERMNRRQFLPGSGVIIDECPAHGVWLDLTERQRILVFARSGGAAQALQRMKDERGKAVSKAPEPEPGLLSSDGLGGEWIPRPLDLLGLNPLDHAVWYVARLIWRLLD
jgi:Zn-finger nucleic acid-binding protein